MPSQRFSRDLQYNQHILTPGYLAVTKEPALLCSVCGSGVVVIVRDRLSKVAGMAHCVMAVKKHHRAMNYAPDVAIPQLIRHMQDRNARLSSMEAQLYGAGHCTGYPDSKGRKMVDVVRKVLRKFKIEVVSQDTGGTIGRKIMFDTASGDVIVWKTKKVRRTDWFIEHTI